MRVNVSLDTLDPRAVRPPHARRAALDGPRRHRGHGHTPVRRDEAQRRRGARERTRTSSRHSARFAWDRGMTPRFLEIMGVGEGARIPHKLVPYAEQRARLSGLLEADHGAKDVDRGPARYVRARPEHGPRRIGFITGTTDTYCDGCDPSARRSRRHPPPLPRDERRLSRQAPRRHEATSRGYAHASPKLGPPSPDGVTFRGCTEPSAREVSIPEHRRIASTTPRGWTRVTTGGEARGSPLERPTSGGARLVGPESPHPRLQNSRLMVGSPAAGAGVWGAWGLGAAGGLSGARIAAAALGLAPEARGAGSPGTSTFDGTAPASERTTSALTVLPSAFTATLWWLPTGPLELDDPRPSRPRAPRRRAPRLPEVSP
jgi:hypothetical protein